MSNDFKQLLIDSIPFEETDTFFERSRQGAKAIADLGVTTKEEMLNLLENTRVNTEIRQQVAAFSAWLKHKPAIEPLIRIATNGAEGIEIRRTAAVYLSILGRSKVFGVLKNLSLYDPDPEIRISAISAFTVAPNKRVFNLLTKIITQDNSPKVRSSAIRAISSIPQSDKQRAFELFFSRFTDSSEDTIVRAYAVEGLGYLKDKRAIDIVISNLSNEAPEIRYMCAYALGLMGDKSHLPLLEALTTDDAIFENWGTVADGAAEGITEIMEQQKRLI